MGKKRKLKAIGVITSFALSVSLLSACGGASSKTTTGSASGAKGETTITLNIDNSTNQDGIKAVAAYIEKKDHIKTKFDIRPTGGDGDNLVKTRLATGDMSDILFYNSGSLLQALNPSKNFVDLTNKPYMKSVEDAFKKTVTVGGKVYGAPSGESTVGAWLYNKKVYQQLGLSVPNTWAQLIQNSEKIKAAGKTAIIGSFKDTWTTQLIVLADNYNVMQKDPTWAADYSANKAKFATTPAALQSFKELAEVKQKSLMNSDYLATDYNTALKMLADGTGAQYPILSSALTNIATTYPDKINDIGIFPQPSDSPNINGYTVWMPSSYYINKNGKNVAAAETWVADALSPGGIKAYLSKVKPAGPFVVKGVNLPSDSYPAVKQMLPFFENGKTAPALEFLSPVKGPNLEQITQAVGSGQYTAEKGAQLYDQDVTKEAQQLGLKGW